MSNGNPFLVLVQEKEDWDSKNLGLLIRPLAKKSVLQSDSSALEGWQQPTAK